MSAVAGREEHMPLHPARRAVAPIAAAWLLSVGFDLFLHAGLLAGLYVEPSPFLLPPAEAFRRIPYGYLAFLILAGALFWLIVRLNIRGWVTGFRFGAAVGGVVWGALAVGLYSITTATVPLLAGWWIGQAVELGLAGAVLAGWTAGASLKRIWIRVLLAVLLLVSATVLLQSFGLAPAVKSGL